MLCVITMLGAWNRYYRLFLPFAGTGSLSLLQTWHASVDPHVYPETLSVIRHINVAKSITATANIERVPGGDPGLFACPSCRKLYRNRRNMLAHLRFECGQLPQLKCQFCSYRSKRKYDLKRHIRIRHEEKY